MSFILPVLLVTSHVMAGVYLSQHLGYIAGLCWSIGILSIPFFLNNDDPDGMA